MAGSLVSPPMVAVGIPRRIRLVARLPPLQNPVGGAGTGTGQWLLGEGGASWRCACGLGLASAPLWGGGGSWGGPECGKAPGSGI